MTRPANPGRQAGMSMIEVLVSILIVVLGLLGLAGLQSHATLAESEAFQRAQAIVLLQDMTDRLNAARPSAAAGQADLAYVTPQPLGTGQPLLACESTTGVARDHCEWNRALLGAAETAAGNTVGAMEGARGCVTLVSGQQMPREYEIAVVWQGVALTKAPGTECGKGEYGDERQRRAMTTRVVMGCLFNDAASGLCLTP